MLNFKFHIDKAIASILYITKVLQEKTDKRSDFHKVFKILFFADQKHLSRYGRPVVGDYYVAMRHGPVPSRIYDILKSIRGDSPFSGDEFEKYFAVDRHFIKPRTTPDMEMFSDSDLECLEESINENFNLDFFELRDKSHGRAYQKATKDDKISYREMAKEIGTSEEMIKYMMSVSENQQIFMS